MIKDVRLKLIELARLRTTWSYSQLNDQRQLGLNFSNPLDRDLIGEWLVTLLFIDGVSIF